MKSPEGIPLYKHIVPWIAGIAILLFLFWRIDMQEFFHALQQANLYIYLPVITIFIFVWFSLESQNLTASFHHFGHKIPYNEMLNIRGTTYLLMVMNYNLGMGGIIFYTKKLKGLSLFRVSSVIFFYIYAETISLSFMAAVGCLFTPEPSVIIDRIFYTCSCIVIGYIIGLPLYRRIPQRGFWKKLKVSVWETFDEASLKTFVVLPLWRGLYFSTFILFFYIALKAFNINIPLLTLAAVVPVIFFIGNIPITPFGLGTIQAAMLLFFKNYSSEANIMAFSIVYTTSLLLFRIPIGFYYLRKTPKADAQKEKIIATTQL